MQILEITKDINAFNMLYIGAYFGTIYFLLALAAFGIAWMSKPSTKAKGLIGVGILMAIFSVTSLLAVSYAISQMESELGGNPFGVLAGVHIGIGLILAIMASIIVIYTGYKLSSPDLSTSVPKIRSRKVLIAINYILVLWTLLFLIAGIAAGGGKSPNSFVSAVVVSYLIMVVTYFYIGYTMRRLTERSKIVYSAFIGFVAVLIVMIVIVTNPKTAENMLGYSVNFALIPLLVYVADLWYARK
ncbi:MAG: hypothetical protein U9O90_01185 [Euryarchaeota archaeon]|nr:hypothetical protein [Euryarchaeota archaeon]